MQQDCRKCSKPEHREKRKEWGCDAPIPVWNTIDCFACAQADSSEDCDACGGTGEFKLDRCPWTYAGAAERFVCEIVPAWCEHGVNPLDVAPADWPATFYDAVQIVIAEYVEVRDKDRP